MNRPQRQRSNQRHGRQGNRPAIVDLWRTADPPPDVAPIAVPDEVGALLRSLGDAPRIGGSAQAGHYFTAVVERAATVAAALALSADLLAQPNDD